LNTDWFTIGLQMLTKVKIAQIAKEKGRITTKDILGYFPVSRQYASALIGELVAEGNLIKLGSTHNAFYVAAQYAEKHPEIFPVKYAKTFKNISLEEHRILDEIERTFPLLVSLPENIRSIFTFAFSEMLNNAIEHSQSKIIHLEVSMQNNMLSFSISDSGIGAFRNIMQKKALQSELEAVQDLLKGKTTTMPKSHSGEGIFFTSKVGDLFVLDSYGYQLVVNNEISDVFVHPVKKMKKGTKVAFRLRTTSPLHLNDVFKKYTNIDNKSDHGFDKTEIRVKLYTVAGIHISRSQARRVLSGLEKFKVVVFDYDKVPVVGQAFVDEIYRVFQHRHPAIKLENIHMNDGVKFMIERGMNEAEK
jgi:anti-sigma regulatory factor (Ser/Thr protein kinase)